MTGTTAVCLQERADRKAASEGTARLGTVMPVDLGYTLWAATYDGDPNPLLALEERVLEPRLPEVRNKAVLDVGCGTGRWLIKLLQRGARCGLGIDLSAEMLRYAVSKRPPPGAWLARGDALAIPLRPRTIDLVVCSFVLGHICSLRKLGWELARVARNGADICVSGLHPEARARGWRCAFRHGTGTVEIPEFDWPLEALLRFFEAEGLESVCLLEPRFGSEERPIFVKGNKAEQFEAATTMPAIFIAHFQRQ